MLNSGAKRLIHIQSCGTRLIETPMITVFLPIEIVVLSQHTDNSWTQTVHMLKSAGQIHLTKRNVLFCS